MPWNADYKIAVNNLNIFYNFTPLSQAVGEWASERDRERERVCQSKKEPMWCVGHTEIASWKKCLVRLYAKMYVAVSVCHFENSFQVSKETNQHLENYLVVI